MQSARGASSEPQHGTGQYALLPANMWRDMDDSSKARLLSSPDFPKEVGTGWLAEMNEFMARIIIIAFQEASEVDSSLVVGPDFVANNIRLVHAPRSETDYFLVAFDLCNPVELGGEEEPPQGEKSMLLARPAPA